MDFFALTAPVDKGRTLFFFSAPTFFLTPEDDFLAVPEGFNSNDPPSTPDSVLDAWPDLAAALFTADTRIARLTEDFAADRFIVRIGLRILAPLK